MSSKLDIKDFFFNALVLLKYHDRTDIPISKYLRKRLSFPNTKENDVLIAQATGTAATHYLLLRTTDIVCGISH